MDPEQKKILAGKTAEEKIHTAADLYQLAWALKSAGIRMLHADWTEDQVRKKVRECFLYARG
jgi:hypothetical protein